MAHLKKGQYCLCRISTRETLALHVISPQSSSSFPDSSSIDQNNPPIQSKKPIKRLYLIFDIIGEQMGLLRVSSFNGNPHPEEGKKTLLAISPNEAMGEPSIITTPEWKRNIDWQYCGIPMCVNVGKVISTGPPTLIKKSSMLDIIHKHEQLSRNNVCTYIFPVEKEDDLSDDLPLAFAPVVDFWVGPDIIAEMEEAEYDFDDEMEELGLLIDKLNDE